MTIPSNIEDKFERVLRLLLNHGYDETADAVRDIRDYCKGLAPEERLISYETLQERNNELLDVLRWIKDKATMLEGAKAAAEATLDGDKFLPTTTNHE